MNLVNDGSFEEIPDSDLNRINIESGGWTLLGQAKFRADGDDSINTPYGSKYAAMFSTGPNSNSDISQQLNNNLPVGTYQFAYSFALPIFESGTNTCTFSITGGGDSSETLADQQIFTAASIGTSFRSVTKAFTTTGVCYGLYLDLMCTGSDYETADVTLLIDNFSITAA